MKSTFLQWALIVGCASGLFWQQSKIGDLEEAVSGESATIVQHKASGVRRKSAASDGETYPQEKSRSFRQLETRVASLEQQGVILARQIAYLVNKERGDPTEAELEARPVRTPEAVDEALDVVLNDPRAAEQLRSMIREEQDAVWQKRRDQRWERRRERLDEEIQALNEMLELSDSEADSFNKMIVSENESIRGFWNQVRSGELSRSQARQATRLRRVETDNKVKDLIDENRYASFENWRNERYRRNRR